MSSGLSAARDSSSLARLLLALCSLVVALQLSSAKAQTPVSLELVLAVDTSESVDGFEYDLLRRGMAAAFRDPEVVELIKLQDGVAVTLFQWSSSVNRRFTLPWVVLRSEADCLAFAARVEQARRDPHRGFTAIGQALAFGIDLLAKNNFEGRRLVIDVSGDGRSNRGADPAVVRQSAGLLGIVINGLPIITSTYEGSYSLDRYYREQIIQGPGAFLEVANDYDDFGRAFQRKLARELAPNISLLYGPQ